MVVSRQAAGSPSVTDGSLIYEALLSGSCTGPVATVLLPGRSRAVLGSDDRVQSLIDCSRVRGADRSGRSPSRSPHPIYCRLEVELKCIDDLDDSEETWVNCAPGFDRSHRTDGQPGPNR